MSGNKGRPSPAKVTVVLQRMAQLARKKLGKGDVVSKIIVHHTAYASCGCVDHLSKLTTSGGRLRLRAGAFEDMVVMFCAITSSCGLGVRSVAAWPHSGAEGGAGNGPGLCEDCAVVRHAAPRVGSSACRCSPEHTDRSCSVSGDFSRRQQDLRGLPRVVPGRARDGSPLREDDSGL